MGDLLQVIPSGRVLGLRDTNVQLLRSQPEVLPFACPQVPMVLLRCVSKNASCAHLHTRCVFPNTLMAWSECLASAETQAHSCRCGPGSVSARYGWHSLLARPLSRLSHSWLFLKTPQTQTTLHD